MSDISIDAGVGVKWFVPEVHATEARPWRNGPGEWHMPATVESLAIKLEKSAEFPARDRNRCRCSPDW